MQPQQKKGNRSGGVIRSVPSLFIGGLHSRGKRRASLPDVRPNPHHISPMQSQEVTKTNGGVPGSVSPNLAEAFELPRGRRTTMLRRPVALIKLSALLSAFSLFAEVTTAFAPTALPAALRQQQRPGLLDRDVQQTPAETSTLLWSSTTSKEASVDIGNPIQAERSDSVQSLNDPVILFDGVCNFCNAWVDVLIKLDKEGQFKFAALQSETGKRLLTAIGKEEDDISSVVLVRPDLQHFDKSACVLQVVQELGPAAAAVAGAGRILVPRRLRDFLYDTVADNRYNFLGKRDECRCGDPEYADRFLS
jgi:predicted DCC family thiol-disulfide oxidoreductase YuxK